MRLLVALLLLAKLSPAAGSAADLARSLREVDLDPEECYRVREISIVKEDARFYLTDGYLIFSKPVGNTRTSALFTAEIEGGDAEVLLLPPHLGERESLASYIDAPNLSEHFTAAVFLFSDDMYRSLSAQIKASSFNRKSAEMGLVLAGKWTPVVRNISSSFETRLVLDLLSASPSRSGFFMSAISGKQLGNFDIVYDPRAPEQLTVGQVVFRDNRTFFDVWTSFESQSVRNRTRESYTPEFTLRDYRIEATLEPDLRLRVVTRVKLTPSRGEQRAFPFDISAQMRIAAALVNGEPAEILQRESMRSNLIRNTGNELFLLVPPGALETGREHEIEFRHEGKVISQAGNRVYYVGARTNWYPSRGIQFAAYDLVFRYPSALDLVATGDIVEDRTEGEWRITRRKTSSPIRLAGFNLGVYERARLTRPGYVIEVCANRRVEQALQPRPRDALILPPTIPIPRQVRRPEILALPQEPVPDPTSRLQELASAVASAIEFMSAHFGPPPLRSLTVSPVPGTFGQGFPGLIYLSTLAYLRPQDKPIAAMTERQQIFFSEILQAHEAAHQWWGNLVTPTGYHDEWLMEALANYSALLHLEKRKGVRALDSVLEEYRTNLLAKNETGQTVDSTGPIVLGLRLDSSQAPRAWRTITYGKGSWIIHMLRRKMGDERFQTMLGQLRRRYERKSISTEQFHQLAAEFLPPKSSDPKLESFFDQWVYGTGIPTLKLSYSIRGRAPALKLVGTITQSDVGQDFSVQAPIEIQLGRGKTITHYVRTSNEPVSFSVALRQAPAKVLLDPSLSVLAVRR